MCIMVSALHLNLLASVFNRLRVSLYMSARIVTSHFQIVM